MASGWRDTPSTRRHRRDHLHAVKECVSRGVGRRAIDSVGPHRDAVDAVLATPSSKPRKDRVAATARRRAGGAFDSDAEHTRLHVHVLQNVRRRRDVALALLQRAQHARELGPLGLAVHLAVRDVA